MSIVSFLEGTLGRIVRATAGVVLITLGLALGGWWAILAVVGVAPLAAGLFNFCLLAPLFHHPLRGQPS
jgi:Inner membrane protein YgaP-like, transmembrane domain